MIAAGTMPSWPGGRGRASHARSGIPPSGVCTMFWAVVETVERELLTPYGLRTLSPRDSHYRGRFDGDMVSRDSAYHQGTVWPWLMGHFITARVKTHGNSEEARAGAGELLRPLHQHLS